ncbi:L-ornithine N(5)-monooxygenase [Pseudocercospora fuligena]|uniref:L-ornithine N(5)-monooxygenase [NAD(P)H] n=1 Tax=Pseudocercospora fuligena TaxID=685502 RepID=A0A8H6RW04_9PEZI|nr:L-ornithine N(5)-monooxygenase [Pseudocercospora fuligena]
MSLHIEQHNERPERRHSSSSSGSKHIYDVVGIGFGTTSLALAASLVEKNCNAKVLFLERESQFTWNPEHILPDKEVGTSFLRDLATTSNPRSEFTFMKFLHATNQLILFANNSRLTPTRRLMGHYFRWAAAKIEKLGWVNYGQEGIRVRPVQSATSKRVSQWQIETRDSKTGAVSTVRARRIVLATGATPHILAPLKTPQIEPLVLHSSSSTGLLEKLGSLQATLNIAVVGADQEAVELFHHLHTARGKHNATLFFPDSALRPDDHLPSISDMLEKPESAEGSMPPEVRARQHSEQQAPKVHLKTLEHLYEAQYSQKLMEPDSSKWRFQIRPLSEVVGASRIGSGARIVTKSPRTGEVVTSATVFDVIISATGYEFATNMDLVGAVKPLLDASGLTVNREYHVNFRRDVLSRDCDNIIYGHANMTMRSRFRLQSMPTPSDEGVSQDNELILDSVVLAGSRRTNNYHVYALEDIIKISTSDM